MTQAVSEAAAQGDRSENAEYIYGKKQLREIDRRESKGEGTGFREIDIEDALPGHARGSG